jgi:hypothetical protein
MLPEHPPEHEVDVPEFPSLAHPMEFAGSRSQLAIVQAAGKIGVLDAAAMT